MLVTPALRSQAPSSRIRNRFNQTLAGGGLAILIASAASAATIVVADGDSVVFDAAGSPFVTEGASIGSPQGLSQPFILSTGTLTLEADATWTNNGGYGGFLAEDIGLFVGTNFGVRPSVGTLILDSSSTFNSTGSVRIGGNSLNAGYISLGEGAVWNNTGRDNHVDFQLNNGTLNLQGELTSNTPATIGGAGSGGVDTNSVVSVSGLSAMWEVGSSLDVYAGGGGSALLHITGGGRVISGFTTVGGGSLEPETGQAIVGSFDDSVTSTWETGFLEIAPFTGSVGTVTVQNNGRILTNGLRLGRAEGTGHLIVDANGAVAVSGFVTSTVEIFSGSTIDLSTGGRMLLGTGLLNMVQDGAMRVGPGGTLKGTGTVIGDVYAAGGRIDPGHSPGKLTIDGDLILETDSILTIEIGGTGAGQFDQLDVLGSTTLGGVLNLVFLDGFDPASGAGFSLPIFLNVAGIGGAFDDVTFSGLDTGLSPQVDFGQLLTGQLAVEIVPEPASLSLAAGAMALLLRRRR